jgi:hypothetical protein
MSTLRCAAFAGLAFLICSCGDSSVPDETSRTFELLGCADLATADRSRQVAIVTADPSCSETFVNLLVARPNDYLDAFYDLIASPFTEPLFFSVYSAMGRGAFLFDEPAILKLYVGLPAAVVACGARSRCADWKNFVVSRLESGGLYRCPALTTLARSALLKVIPHGDYGCTENLATRLAALADSAMIDTLRSGASTSSRAWARRNHLRILGRFATGATSTARTLVTTTRRADVLSTLHARLSAETADEALHDILWILDTSFYPDFAAEAGLESLAESTTRSASIRFRAIAALTRLYSSKAMLDAGDAGFLQRNARSDDLYVRAQVAFYMSTASAALFTTTGLRAILDAIAAQFGVESSIVAQVYQARALDRHRGGTREATLRASYEAAHLPNRLSRGASTIQSGLPASELSALADLLDAERAVFAKLLGGAPFDTAVPADMNPAMTLIVFATRAEYRDYMEAFVGSGRDAGGLYLERVGRLYTFARTPAESTFTLKELVQHEYGHYLQGRFVYPGIWGEPGDFAEPRGWADEGLAEVLAGLSFGGGGTYSMPPRVSHLAALCGTTRRLGALLDMRAGYDQSGTFDYAGGWSYVYFLITTRSSRAHDTYAAWRDRTYRRANVHTLAGSASLTALESAHQTALDGWCAARPLSRTAEELLTPRPDLPSSPHVPRLLDAPSTPQAPQPPTP